MTEQETEAGPSGKEDEAKRSTDQRGTSARDEHRERSSERDESDERDAAKSGGGGDGEADEKDEPDGTPFYKRPMVWIVGAVLLVVVIVGGLLWWLHARRFESTDDAFVDAHIVRLAPQEAGILTWVADADNRHVKAGQLLAVIEPSRPEAQRAQAVAQLSQALAGVKEAEGRLIAARASRAQTAANARAPAAEAVKAADDYARYRALTRLDRAAVAGTQLDQARAQAESSAAQAAAARRQIASADADILVAARQRDAAEAQVSAARAQVSQADVTLHNLRLIAPVSGQVVNRSVNLGSYVAPGTQLLALVPDAIWITANFKETQLTHMQAGQHVDIRVDAYPAIRFEGHVDSIQRGAGQAFALLPPQNATGNYVKVVQRVPVRILFDRPDPRRWAIGPGMSVVPTVTVR